MTYYVAQSNRDSLFPYICINSHCGYQWYRQLQDITPYNLSDKDPDSVGIEQWLIDLPINNMTLLYTFTQESNPEYFI